MTKQAIYGKSSMGHQLNEPPPIFSRHLQRIALFCFSLFVILACLGDPQPTTFTMGEKIPQGSDTLTVSHVKAGMLKGKSLFLVFLEVTGTGHDFLYHTSFSYTFSKGTPWPQFGDSFTIVDSNGQKHYPDESMPTVLFRALEAGEQDNVGMLGYAMGKMEMMEKEMKQIKEKGDRSAPLPELLRDWVIIFDLPQESHASTLLIENPNPLKDQPRLAAIPLDRKPAKVQKPAAEKKDAEGKKAVVEKKAIEEKRATPEKKGAEEKKPAAEEKSAEFYLKRAVGYTRNRQYDRAIAACNEALKFGPQNMKVYISAQGLRAVNYQEKGNLDQALKDINNVLDLFDKLRGIPLKERRLLKGSFYAGRARVYFEKKCFNEAHADLLKAKELGFERSWFPPNFGEEIEKSQKQHEATRYGHRPRQSKKEESAAPERRGTQPPSRQGKSTRYYGRPGWGKEKKPELKKAQDAAKEALLRQLIIDKLGRTTRRND